MPAQLPWAGHFQGLPKGFPVTIAENDDRFSL